uniref:Uncharacterized protein n=1 Tax=Davidia involucrata TaxID=16924 RepID=A0A5B6YXV4_DAVIN
MDDLGVTHNLEDNSCIFRHKGKNIRLQPFEPKKNVTEDIPRPPPSIPCTLDSSCDVLRPISPTPDEQTLSILNSLEYEHPERAFDPMSDEMQISLPTHVQHNDISLVPFESKIVTPSPVSQLSTQESTCTNLLVSAPISDPCVDPDSVPSISCSSNITSKSIGTLSAIFECGLVAYLLDIPLDFNISSIFHMEDMLSNRGTLEPRVLLDGFLAGGAVISPILDPVSPPVQEPSLTYDEFLLASPDPVSSDDAILCFRGLRYCSSSAYWFHVFVLCHADSHFLEPFPHYNSPESSSSQPRRNDGERKGIG